MALAILAVSLGGSCQRVTSNVHVSNENVAKSNTAVAASNTAAATNSQPAAAENAPAGTPAASYMAAYTARNNKDIAGLKKLLSKDILEFFTEIQKTEKKTLDDALRELCEQPQAPKAEIRNEKIEGDTASLEFKDEDGGWKRMDFIKEDGTWKLTIPPAEMREMRPPTDQKKG